MRHEPAIETRGLTKKYKEVTAVNNLHLLVPQGQVFGFLGPNGAGKTTTIRMLLGLIAPTSGEARILGYDTVRERATLARKVAAVVETPMFYDFLTGRQNLDVFARTSGLSLPESRFGELLELVNLTERARHTVKTYSLGMKQRLGIAATLLNDPEVVFLDEPTNGLDPNGTVEMRALISRIAEQGRTVFLSSHLLNEVEQVCSEVAIIQHGVVKLQGRVADLVGASDGFLLKAVPAERALDILDACGDLRVARLDDEWIRVTARESDVPSILRRLHTARIDVFQIKENRTSLESVFLEQVSTARGSGWVDSNAHPVPRAVLTH